MPKGESIEKRPAHINDRSEPFHWDGDAVKGTVHSKRCVLTLTERMSCDEIALPMPACNMASVVSALNGIERELGEDFNKVFKSITFDDGSEFQDCEGIEKSADGTQRTKVYYCHSYRSNERGTNENHNGMLQRRHPKGTYFDNVPDEEILRTAAWMNNYPRRKPKGDTPARVFRRLLHDAGVQ